MATNISDRQEKFLRCIVYKNMEPWEAFKENYSSSTISKKEMTKRADKILAGEAVQKMYQSLLVDKMHKGHVDETYVIDHLKSLAENAKSETAKKGALELLGKYLGKKLMTLESGKKFASI